MPSLDWNAPKNLVRDEFLTIDFASFRQGMNERLDRLRAARAMVVSGKRIIGGVLVVKGRRVPVYDVAASVSAGISVDEILAAYPSLKAEHFELAGLTQKQLLHVEGLGSVQLSRVE
jgi:uncharacterized protein (DUF433 family)